MAQLTHNIARIYQHVQASASDTWVIVHNLQMYPAIDVYIDYLGEKHKILPAGVAYDSPNQCTVTFSVARTGLATVA
jgi:hypothetical protein